MTDQDQLDAAAAAREVNEIALLWYGLYESGFRTSSSGPDERLARFDAAWAILDAAVRERDELRAAAEAVIADWEGTDEDEEYLSPEFAPKLLALRAALHPKEKPQ